MYIYIYIYICICIYISIIYSYLLHSSSTSKRVFALSCAHTLILSLTLSHLLSFVPFLSLPVPSSLVRISCSYMCLPFSALVLSLSVCLSICLSLSFSLPLSFFMSLSLSFTPPPLFLLLPSSSLSSSVFLSHVPPWHANSINQKVESIIDSAPTHTHTHSIKHVYMHIYKFTHIYIYI